MDAGVILILTFLAPLTLRAIMRPSLRTSVPGWGLHNSHTARRALVDAVLELEKPRRPSAST